MRKYLWIVISCFLALFLATDKFTFYKNLQNDVFRIDISGNKNNDTIKTVDSDNLKFNKANWRKNYFTTNEHFSQTQISAQIKTTSNDTIHIKLMGPDVRQENENIPVVVTYKNLIINDKPVLSGPIHVYHDKPYEYKKQIKSGETINISVIPEKTTLFHWLPCLYFNFLKFLLYFCAFFTSYIIIERFLKKNKNASVPDLIFVVIFMILLFIPLTHISNAEKSDQENRTLATKPNLFIDKKINQKYGVEFNNWFNDRFNGRDLFVTFYNSAKYKMSDHLVVQGRYIDRNKKWIMASNKSYKLFQDNELQTISRNINKLKKFSSNHNMKFYILIAPTKMSVYGKQILPGYKGTAEQKRTKQAIDYIKEHNNVNIIYPYKEIFELSKHDMAFFKTDPHWTDSAAFVAYQKLMEEIKKDFHDIKVLKADDFDYFYSNKVRVTQSAGLHTGREYNMLKMNDETFFDTDFKYFEHNNKDKLNVKIFSFDEKNYEVRQYRFAGKTKYNLTLFGDSFGENMEPIIPYNFKDTLRLYTYVPSPNLNSTNLNIQRFETDILQNKTNIIVIVFSDIDRLMYLYKE